VKTVLLKPYYLCSFTIIRIEELNLWCKEEAEQNVSINNIQGPALCENSVIDFA